MSQRIFELTDRATGSVARISSVGASLVSLSLSGKEVIAECSPNDPKLFAGAVLAPWSSRIKDGKWLTEEGESLQLEINEPDRGNALHGLVYDQSFEVARSTDSMVELAIEIAATAGFPFHLMLSVSYELDQGELYCSFAVKNLSESRAPFGIAFHPYITSTLSTGSLSIQNQALSFFDLDQNMIAKGKLPVAKSAKDLSLGKKVPAAGLDDNYTDLVFVDGISVTKVLDDAGSGILLWQEDIFMHTVIYTTDRYPTSLGPISAVAIEPSTSENNSLNTKQDLLWIAPKQTRSGAWGIRLV